MTSTATTSSRTAARLALGTALGSVMLTGCAMGGGGDRPSAFAAQAEATLAKGKPDKAIVLAEKAVAASPREAAQRALLGNAYLKAGRFVAAAQSFDDALDLGDESPRTVLSLALAEIAQGHQSAAVQLLTDWRDVIPASDLGLAMALAGETGRGVDILSQALRDGDSTVKTRQNLAYAFALDGRWREARVMMAQDVPADEINDRIGEWAAMGRPEDNQLRVATLLGAPVRGDDGQPQALALANFPGAAELAAEAAAAPVAGEAVPEAPVELASNQELAPVAPAAQPVAPAAPAPAQPTQVSVAVVQPLPAAAAMEYPAPRFAGPKVAAKQPRMIGNYAPEAPKTVRSVRAAAAQKMTGNSPVLVQLGAFSSPESAQRAIGTYKRHGALADYRLVTTSAFVNGKQYWRVSASGFAGRSSASATCSTLRQGGNSCFVVNTPGAGGGAQYARR